MTTNESILTELAELRENDTTDYHCPAWCARTDHHADVVDQENMPIHYGPEFGLVCVQAVAGERFEVLLSEPGPTEVVGPAGLRKLSADALAAAEWLEAQASRSAGPSA